PKRELTRTRHGQRNAPTSEARFGFHGPAEPNEMFQEVTRRFARQIAARLKGMRGDFNFDSMIVAASPKFLGLLRKEMDKETKKSIKRWVNKDLSVLSPIEISDH